MVIIGLIIGGMTVGQDLIKSAELNSVVTDINKYKTAINTFKLKYNRSLPGDLTNAQSYWPSCTDDGDNLCNGDGSGAIGAYFTDREDLRAWQHLSLSEIISGSYTGVYSSPILNIGVNMPASSITGGGFWLSSTYPAVQNTYTITFGSESNNSLQGPIVTPTAAKSIDDKIDDGVANRGKVRTTDGNGVTSYTCRTSNDQYILSETSISCQMRFYE